MKKAILFTLVALVLTGCGQEELKQETFAHSFVENIEVETIEVEEIQVNGITVK